MKFCKEIKFAVMFSVAIVHQTNVHADTKEDFKVAVDFIKRIAKEAKESLKKKYKITLRQLINGLPGLNKIKFSGILKKYLDTIEFQTPKLKIHENTYELEWVDALVFGVRRKITIRLYVGPGKDNGPAGFSLGIGIPGIFTLNTLVPEIKQNLLKAEAKLLPKKLQSTLKKAKLSIEDLAGMVDWLQFERMVFVLSTQFNDPVWGPLEFGFNFIGTARFTGPLLKLMNIFGKDLTTLKVRGLIVPTPSLGGTELRAIYPGKFTLFRLPRDPKKPAMFHLRTGDIEFRIGLTSSWPAVPTIKATSGFELKLPGQKDYIALKGFADIRPSGKAVVPHMEIGGQMDGILRNMFGFPGINIGNLGISAVVSLVTPWVWGLGVQGETQIGPLKRKGIALINVANLEFAFLFKLGKISNKDVIDFIMQMMTEAVKLGKIKVNLSGVKSLFYKTIPPFQLSDCEYFFVPLGAEVFGKKYGMGVYLKGHAELWGMGGGVDLALTFGGFKAVFYLNEVRIPKKNPLIIISGAGRKMKLGIGADGPVMIGELTFKRQLFYMDSILNIPGLKIKSNTHIAVSPLGIKFDIRHKLGGIYEAEFHVRGNPTSIDSFWLKGYMHQQALTDLGKLLINEARKFSQKAHNDLKIATQNVQNWQRKAEKDIDTWVSQQVAGVDQNINKLKARISKATQRCKRAKFIEKIPKCAEIALVPAWGTVLGTLLLHKEVILKKISRTIAKGGTRFASGVAQTGLATARASVAAAQAMTQFAGTIIGGAFNLSKVEMEGSLREFIEKGVLPKVDVVGIVLGKPFKQTYEVNFRKPQQFPQQIFNGLVQVLKKPR